MRKYEELSEELSEEQMEDLIITPHPPILQLIFVLQ